MVPPDVKQAVAAAVYNLGLKMGKGLLVEDHYYRRNRHLTPDLLLDNTGIMHLHPLGAGTSELLFLVQYERSVLFLEVSDHHHFAVLPHGHLLLTVHSSAVLDREQDDRWAEQQRQEA